MPESPIRAGSPVDVLNEYQRWLAWKWEERTDPKTGEIKLTKPPYSRDGHTVSVKNQAHWMWKAEAASVPHMHGIGFALFQHPNIAALDLDHCRERETGEITNWARQIVEMAGSYTEITPSGEGLRILGVVPEGTPEAQFIVVMSPDNPGEKIEVYVRCARYVTMSGELWEELPTAHKALNDIAVAVDYMKTLKMRATAGENAGDSGSPDPDLTGLPPWLCALIRDGVPKGERSEALFKVVAALRRYGYAADRIVQILRHHRNGIGAKTFESGKDETERHVRLILRKIDDEAAQERAQGQTRTPTAAEALDVFARQALPEFPLDCLPKSLRAFVEVRAERSGADISAWALTSLALVLGVIDHRIRLKPLQYDPYTVQPNFWTMLVGSVSSRKTAPMKALIHILRGMDIKSLRTWEEMAREAEAAAEAAQEEFDADSLPPPRLRTLSDTTSEGLLGALQRRPCGIMLARDELSGWIAGMERYGGAGRSGSSDRALFLESFDGGPFVQARADKKKNRTVPNLSCAIAGTIQPERIRQLGNLDADGLIQRFSFCLLQPAVASVDLPHDAQVDQAVLDLLEKIEGLGLVADGQPFPIPCSLKARAAYAGLEQTIVDLGRTPALTEAFCGFLGKQPKNYAALCLVLHVVAIAEGRASRTDSLSGATARAAERILREFLIPHGYAFFDMLQSGSMSKADQAIGAAILRCPTDEITIRDITHRCKAMRGAETYQDRVQIMQRFVAFGWLTQTAPTSPRYLRTPGLVERFATELATYRASARAVHEAITKAGARRKAEREAQGDQG